MKDFFLRFFCDLFFRFFFNQKLLKEHHEKAKPGPLKRPAAASASANEKRPAAASASADEDGDEGGENGSENEGGEDKDTEKDQEPEPAADVPVASTPPPKKKRNRRPTSIGDEDEDDLPPDMSFSSFVAMNMA